MIAINTRLGLAFGLSLVAGTAVLAGCGPTPVTRTTTTTEQITTTPAPPVIPVPMQSTTTTETTQVHHP